MHAASVLLNRAAFALERSGPTGIRNPAKRGVRRDTFRTRTTAHTATDPTTRDPAQPSG